MSGAGQPGIRIGNSCALLARRDRVGLRARLLPWHEARFGRW